MERIILASASPRRKELLALLGVDFEIIPAKGEEILATSDPAQAVQELSRQKAEEVAANAEGDVLVIGADTVVALEGEILGKPKDEKEAFRMIEKLSGRVHSVYTGVTFILNGMFGQTGGGDWLEKTAWTQSRTFYEETKVKVSALDREQIQYYVNLGESLDKAGAYAIQGVFGTFIEGIEGDYNNVVGLPVSRLYRELRLAGIDLLQGNL